MTLDEIHNTYGRAVYLEVLEAHFKEGKITKERYYHELDRLGERTIVCPKCGDSFKTKDLNYEHLHII